MFSYLNFFINDFSVSFGNPDSGKEFIPNRDRFTGKKARLESTPHHPK
jgi:hypothetical protein